MLGARRIPAVLPPALRDLARGRSVAPARPRIGTGLAALDEILDGGFPCGAVTEVVGGASSGKTTLVQAALAAVTSAGALAAYIDLPNALDPAHAAAAGVRLSHLLWVRPPDARTAFRAAEHVLSAGGFRLVLLDCGGPAVVPEVSAALRLRLTRAARRTEAAVLVLGDRRLVGSFAPLCLEINCLEARFRGGDGPCPLLEGIAGTARVRSSKLGPLSTRPARIVAVATA